MPRRNWVLTLGLAGTLAAGTAFAFQNNDTIRIGSINTLTGVASPYGTLANNGSRIAVDEINAAGGVEVAGKKVKIEIVPEPDGYDDGDNTVQSLALFKKLVFDDKVIAVKGVTRSISVETVFNYLKEVDKTGDGTLLISPSSATAGLGGITPWGFRNAYFEYNGLDQQIAMIKEKFGYKTAAVFVERDNPYNVSLLDDTIVPLLKKHGIELVATVDCFGKAQSNYSREVNTLRDANPDFVILSSLVQTSVNLMKESKRRGFKPAMWVGSIGLLSPEVPELGGDAVERMIVGAAYAPTAPSVLKFIEEYTKRYGHEPSQNAFSGHETMYLLKAAIESANIANTPDTLKEDRLKLREAMAKVEIDSVKGGRVHFAPNGDAVSQVFNLTLQGGKFVEWDGNPFP